MAVTLSIDLSDSEQAKLAEIAGLVAPGMSPAEVKAWAERTAKAALRAEVVDRYGAWRRDQENAARRTGDDELSVAWPLEEEAAP